MKTLEFVEIANCLRSKGLGFIYEHDRYAIADFIQKPTLFTYKTITCLIQPYLAFALRASKNF